MRSILSALVFLLIGISGSYIFFSVSRDIEVIDMHSLIPYDIGQWHGEDLKLKEYVYKILGSKNVLSRRYSLDNDSQQVFLTIVASDNDRRVVHPPEVCLKGGGEKVIAKDVIQVAGIRVNQLLLAGRPNQKVWYWYALGPEFTVNYYWHQIKGLFYRLMNRPRRAYLIRVVFFEGQEAIAREFVVSLLKILKNRL